MKISFLTSGHMPYDDRIFYHMGRSFTDRGWSVEIVSSKIDLIKRDDGISLNCFNGEGLSKKEKIRCFTEKLASHKPDIIICSEPLSLVAARKYSKTRIGKIKVVYDITEWYPSKKNLEGYNFFMQFFVAARFLIFNLLASSKTDAFIFGEWYKSRPYRLLFPKKPSVYISYYPDSKYITKTEPFFAEKKLRLCYSGRISIEKGFGHFMKVLRSLSGKHKELIIDVKIIGWYETQNDRNECAPLLDRLDENVLISFFERQPLKQFIELISDRDIFLDLRSGDFENNHCLPIKLFYYAALGRPVVFTNLKAIRREVEIQKFGHLVNPGDTDEIVRIIDMYQTDRELYFNHCSNARNMFEINYNWKKIEPELLDFINEISPER